MCGQAMRKAVGEFKKELNFTQLISDLKLARYYRGVAAQHLFQCWRRAVREEKIGWDKTEEEEKKNPQFKL